MLILQISYKILMKTIEVNLYLASSDSFDPEILTYLNDSLRDDVIEKLDIKKLASNVSELDVDDAVDVVEDLEESDTRNFFKLNT